MTGIFFFVVLAVWFWVCIVIARAVMRRLTVRFWKLLVGLTVFVALLMAPVADELVGGVQFRALCVREAVLDIDAAKVRGRTMRRLGVKLPRGSAAIDIERWRESFLDATSGEELIRYVWLRASGGWLVRTLHISQGNEPLLIDPFTCDPGRRIRWEEAYGFVLIDN